ncbi:MAG: AI-2E family transporter [DPANN group archaeon]|nr:AI-2E family transporter [DPANN group archaeon]
MKEQASKNKQIDSTIIYSILLTSGILVLLYYVLKMVLYFTPAITIALLIIYITRPIYTRVEKITKSKAISILFAMALTITILLIFVVYFTSSIILEAIPLVTSDSLNSIFLNYGVDMTQLSIQLVNLLASLDLSNITYASILSGDYLLPIKGIASYFITGFMNIGYLLLQAFMSLMIAFYWVKDRDKLKKFISEIIPKSNHELLNKFIYEFDISLNQIYMGVFFTAIFTSILAYPVYLLFNLPFSTILAVMTGIVSIVPLVGSSLIYTPITLILFLIGDLKKALIFFFVCMFVISTIPDWITKPFIMAKDRKTNLLLIIISILGGLAVFGTLGALIGPIVMSIFTSFIYAYKQNK